jgi:hypothetical protein
LKELQLKFLSNFVSVQATKGPDIFRGLFL